MPLIKGSCIERKGKFFVISLLMSRVGGKEYKQVYGTYIHMKEALAHCRRLNKAGTCDVCHRVKECKYK